LPSHDLEDSMGAKTCLLFHTTGDARTLLAAGPVLDADETGRFVRSLFPTLPVDRPAPATLEDTYVPSGTVVAGCFPGLKIVVTDEVALDRLSQLPSHFIAPQGTTCVHVMHSVADFLSFAVWEDGVLKRSLGVAPDSGVMEDLGERLPFERPYWEGRHPAVDPEDLEAGEAPYPLPFHPLELGEAALLAFLGYQIEGVIDPQHLDPSRIPLLRFGAGARAPAATRRPWWKIW
jgi:hypothetical protein